MLLSCRDRQTLVNVLMDLHPTLVKSKSQKSLCPSALCDIKESSRLAKIIIHRSGTAVIPPGPINKFKKLSGTPDEHDHSRRVQTVQVTLSIGYFGPQVCGKRTLSFCTRRNGYPPMCRCVTFSRDPSACSTVPCPVPCHPPLALSLSQ